jgi:uncharacterized protein YdeI (YjbR/CyaY-like superfamily)
MKITKTLYVHRVKDWRAWLRKNHRKTREIWLVYYKKDSGRPRIAYNDAVDEALCFGWIDSTAKTLDRHRYCQRFSPRRKGSPCSELNKHRAIRLIREKRMTPAGLLALEGTLGGGAKVHRGSIRHTKPWELPTDIERALRKEPKTWRNFQRFPLTYKRIRVEWINAVRYRPEVFRTRLDHFLRMTAANKRYGMLQE